MIWFSVKRNHLTRNGLIFALLVGFSTLAVIFRSLPDLDTLDDCESAFCTARELFRFSAAPTFTCPSPHAHPGWTRPAKIDKLDCTPAETAHDSPWAVQICPWPDTCNSASVLIQLRGHATCDVQRQLSENEELDQHIRKVWGPAEFRLQVEGAEKFSTGQGIFNSETCSYRYDIALATAGDAELSLWQFFEVSLSAASSYDFAHPFTRTTRPWTRWTTSGPRCFESLSSLPTTRSRHVPPPVRNTSPRRCPDPRPRSTASWTTEHIFLPVASRWTQRRFTGRICLSRPVSRIMTSTHSHQMCSVTFLAATVSNPLAASFVTPVPSMPIIPLVSESPSEWRSLAILMVACCLTAPSID